MLNTVKGLVDGNEVDVAVVGEGGVISYKGADGSEQSGSFPDLLRKMKAAADERDAFESKLKAVEPKLQEFLSLGAEVGDLKAALELKKNVKDGQLLDAEKARALREEGMRQVTTEAEAKVAEAVAAARQATAKYQEMRLKQTLGTAVKATIKDAQGKERPIFAMSDQMAYDGFARHFGEDSKGNLVAYYDTDHVDMVMSPTDGVGPATPAEALRKLVERRTDKDLLLAGVAQTGSGQPGGRDSGGGGKLISRSEFDSKSPEEKAAWMKSGGKVVDT